MRHMRGPLRGTVDSKNAEGHLCCGSVKKQRKNNQEKGINYVSNPWVLHTDANTTYQLQTMSFLSFPFSSAFRTRMLLVLDTNYGACGYCLQSGM